MQHIENNIFLFVSGLEEIKEINNEKIFDYVLNNHTLKNFLYGVKDMHLANSVVDAVKEYLIFGVKYLHFKKFCRDHCIRLKFQNIF
jgi:hypothetical protein